MKALKIYHHIAFSIIFVADLFIIFNDLRQLEFIVKPAILLCIIAIFIQMTPAKSKIFKWGLLAFLFSLIGDVVLLFSSSNEIFFLAGIGSFLLAHLFFIITFYRHKNEKPSFLTSKPGWMALILILGILLYFLLFKQLDLVMKLAVLIYTAAISLMNLMALNRKNQVPLQSFLWVTLGAALFFISDGMLAINKFWINIPSAGIWIMGTYMLAQYFILVGLINQEK